MVHFKIKILLAFCLVLATGSFAAAQFQDEAWDFGPLDTIHPEESHPNTDFPDATLHIRENMPVSTKFGISWPVDPEFAYVTSGYGKRVHPIKQRAHFHTGLDIASVRSEAPVRAADDGEVIDPCSIWKTGCGRGWGNVVVIQHRDHLGNERLQTIYGHLASSCSVTVTPGERVVRGQQIGCIGSTGRSNAPHVCFNVRDSKGKYLNPKVVLGHLFASYVRKGSKNFEMLREQMRLAIIAEEHGE